MLQESCLGEDVRRLPASSDSTSSNHGQALSVHSEVTVLLDTEGKAPIMHPCVCTSLSVALQPPQDGGEAGVGEGVMSDCDQSPAARMPLAAPHRLSPPTPSSPITHRKDRVEVGVAKTTP